MSVLASMAEHDPKHLNDRMRLEPVSSIRRRDQHVLIRSSRDVS